MKVTAAMSDPAISRSTDYDEIIITELSVLL